MAVCSTRMWPEKHLISEQLLLDTQTGIAGLTWETAIHLVLRWYVFKEQPIIAHWSVARIPTADGTLCSSVRLFALPSQTSIGELNIVMLMLSSDGEWMGKRALYCGTAVTVDWVTQPAMIEIRRWRLVDDFLLVVK